MISLKRITFLTLILLTFVLMTTQYAAAQARLQVPQVSQKASVMQRIGLSEVSVIYSRPATKGRKVFGDWPTPVAGEATLDNQNLRPKDAPLVPWGHVWRAGANEATVFSITDDVLINGQPLTAGNYELAAIPSKDGDWTIIFNKDAEQWGAFSYDASRDVLRVKTKPQWATDSQEFLTYTIDGVTEDSASVTLRWEKAVVPFTVKVSDVTAKAMARLRTVVANAKTDDWQTPMNAAGYARNSKDMETASKWIDQSLKAIDTVIAAKPNFANMSRKASILFAAGRTQDAVVAGEKAVEVGKAEKADTAALEKRIADAKAAGKM